MLGKCAPSDPKLTVEVSINRSKLLPPSHWNNDKIPAVFIACGSYSPPTIMHTRIFETARDHFAETNIQIVGGFISPVHDAYGKKDLAQAEHRIEMVKRALETSDWINLDDWEVRQHGWTRTRECMDRMYSELNKQTGVFHIEVPINFCVWMQSAI
jgi:nicotinamide mononucleotide adenylyltransferase